jgi:hypothetical protein
MWIFAGGFINTVATLPQSEAISIETNSGLDWAKVVRQNSIAA